LLARAVASKAATPEAKAAILKDADAPLSNMYLHYVGKGEPNKREEKARKLLEEDSV
jgi:hypothetical protein